MIEFTEYVDGAYSPKDRHSFPGDMEESYILRGVAKKVEPEMADVKPADAPAPIPARKFTEGKQNRMVDPVNVSKK